MCRREARISVLLLYHLQEHKKKVVDCGMNVAYELADPLGCRARNINPATVPPKGEMCEVETEHWITMLQADLSNGCQRCSKACVDKSKYT